VVGIAEDGKKLIQMLNSTKADLIILDINMPNLNGMETAEIVLRRFPKMKILIVSQYEGFELMNKMKMMGILGYLPKTFNQDLIIDAINSLKNNVNFFPLLENYLPSKKSNKYNLTSREIEIIQLVCKGNSTKKISETLKLSHYTIETHRKNIVRKTGSKNILELVKILEELCVF